MNVVLAIYIFFAIAYFIWITHWLLSPGAEARIADILSECPESMIPFGLFVMVCVMGLLAVFWPASLIYDFWSAFEQEFDREE